MQQLLIKGLPSLYDNEEDIFQKHNTKIRCDTMTWFSSLGVNDQMPSHRVILCYLSKTEKKIYFYYLNTRDKRITSEMIAS